jgi:diadenosine tetraphosphate (Ap4A) HIT family hydrolase
VQELEMLARRMYYRPVREGGHEMKDPNCIFCKIVSGEIPSEIIWQDNNHLAFLDIFPLRKAQTIVIPKAHIHSSLYAMPDDVYLDLMTAAKRVAELLERSLGSERTMVVGEGLEIDHAHLKLYPRFHEDSGLVHGGPPADSDGLAELGKKIREG